MTDNGRHHEVDAMVGAAAEAARAFRQLDQEQVERIVDAMVRAGVRAAADLAKLAIEETGFGVFEDKVVKTMLRPSSSPTTCRTRSPWVSSMRTSSATSSMSQSRSAWYSRSLRSPTPPRLCSTRQSWPRRRA